MAITFSDLNRIKLMGKVLKIMIVLTDKMANVVLWIRVWRRNELKVEKVGY